jgi:hypothetical protein
MRRSISTVVAGLCCAFVVQTGATAAAPESAVAAVAGSMIPMARVTTDQNIYHGSFQLRGKRGSFYVALAFPSVGRRSWDVIGSDFPRRARFFGQYTRLAGGHGKHVVAGGHKNSWQARLVGWVIPKDRGPKQRIVITLQGRPKGTFVLIPTQPGVLKRDSGTQSSDWNGPRG